MILAIATVSRQGISGHSRRPARTAAAAARTSYSYPLKSKGQATARSSPDGIWRTVKDSQRVSWGASMQPSVPAMRDEVP